MRRLGAAVLATVPAAMLAAAPAAAADLACPARIVVMERSDGPEGFLATPGKSERLLAGIDVYRGELGARRDRVKPSANKTAGKARVTSWQLAKVPNRTLSLVCRYENTEVTLDHEIAPTVARCELSTPRNGGEVKAVCR